VSKHHFGFNLSFTTPSFSYLTIILGPKSYTHLKVIKNADSDAGRLEWWSNEVMEKRIQNTGNRIK